MSEQIGELANSLLRDPVRVEVTPAQKTVEKIEQRLFFVDPTRKTGFWSPCQSKTT